MKVFKGLSQLCQPFPSSIVTIGNFDGLHLGHRQLIQKTLELSEQFSLPSVLLTFHPHPLEVLFPDRPFKRIFGVEDLIEQSKALGVQNLILEPFTKSFSQVTPDHFLENFVGPSLNPKAIIVGKNFKFGKDHKGDANLLKEYSQKLNYDFIEIPSLKKGEKVVSSTWIRQALREGQVELAKDLLSRPFYVRGVVKNGSKRGRTLGFRTANLNLSDQPPLLKEGVYCSRFLYEDQSLPAVSNVGLSPTFEKNQKGFKVETHIIGRDLELYGKDVKVEFYHFIRDARVFHGLTDLSEQIGKDIEKAKEYFNL